MITLAHAGTTLDLSDRLVWTDEYAWSPVVQEAAHSTTGALLLDVASALAGRPITLDGQLGSTWLERTTCNTLAAWAALPGVVFTLVLRGQARQVVFDHSKTGFEAQSLWRLADGQESPEQLFIPILRFIEV